MAINKRRLLKLADFLETVPRKSFEIGRWVARHPHKPEGERPGECGFAGCAIGWAAHAKLFPDLRIAAPDAYRKFTHKGQGVHGVTAAARTFGVDEVQTEHLFMPFSYGTADPTPKQVAKRIRKFVADA